ncbi:MAG TPA: metallophosphoesterase, partial [Saprospiraceae bacterium]|nr:metallophosphoesterase [Saprospiraceae bacterium]
MRDWNDFYKKSFFEKIEEFQAEKKVDLIFFTGDLIDKGGKDFGGAEQGFIEFENNIINPILEFMGLDISRFIICPGNHDINRNADDEISENGLKGTLSSSEKIISFINDSEKKNNYNYIQRIKEYKSFEYKLYDKINVEKTQSIFKFSSKVEIGGVLIGISSLNSSWRCYDENDFGKIIIGENQVNDNYKFIENCRLKIALLHHQSDWFAEAERRIINSHINKNYDLVLSGHVHENISSVTTGFTGACFHNVSPSGLNQIRTDNSTFANGFTIIDYDDNVTCHYLKYNHSQKKFVDNTDVVDKGKITFTIPSVQPADIINSYREAITNIIEDHYEEMNNHFIKGKNNEKDTTVKDAFIYPPIDDGKSYYDLEQTNTNLNDIINSDNHFLFLGEQESGKKSLLYRILVEYVEEFEIYKKIPIFIDFSEVGNKEFITIIKEYCRLGTIKAKEILEHGKFIILIDNLNYHESKNFGNQINKLHKFLKDYPKTRIIGTYENDNQVVLPPEILNHCKIPFSFHYLRGLKSKEIKQIMRQWLPSDDKIKNEESLEKLVNTFSSYHLSNNALSVHLYLWSLENTDRKP